MSSALSQVEESLNSTKKSGALITSSNPDFNSNTDEKFNKITSNQKQNKSNRLHHANDKEN